MTNFNADRKGDIMIEKIRIYESKNLDPYRNLATEKYLMDTTAPGECTLYLWQNQNTVVIGSNQNAWVECRTTLLEQERGKLARRLSGGGAVFHDIGNLNFTFMARKESYDLDRNLAVIKRACAYAGVTAEKSGRNDLLAEGRKFSGNAFYQNKTHAYHHGTLLINVDMEKLQRYLSPSKAKLEAKGIASVRSRVINLQELNPSLSCEVMKQHMTNAFETEYGLKATLVTLTEEDMAAIDTLTREYGSWDYLYGTPLPFTFSCESRYNWGGVQLQLQAKGGIITAVKVYSDSMDWQLPQQVEQALTGCKFQLDAMQESLRTGLSQQEMADDLCNLLAEQSL